MTRALGIGLAIAAALAAVAVGLTFFFNRPIVHRSAPAPEPPAEASVRVSVIAGEAPDRAIVVKERFAESRRADFTDRSLARALGAPEGAWRFVEVWVVNRGSGDILSLGAPPALHGPDGSRIALEPLRDILPAGRAATPRAAMLAAVLAPDPALPLRKGAFRRTVYAMRASVDFRGISSAEADGVRLVPHETTEEALEAIMECPRRDLIAALSKPEDVPATRRQGEAVTEDSR